MTASLSSPSAQRALRSLGENLKIARLKRRISVKGFAERIGASERTVVRLEKGEGGVGIGTLAMACLVLGELDRIASFLDAGGDRTGLLLERERLPKRVRSRRKAVALATNLHHGAAQYDDANDEGVGF